MDQADQALLGRLIKKRDDRYKLAAEKSAALTAIERVKALHRQLSDGSTLCTQCDDTWPCDTIRALEGATDE